VYAAHDAWEARAAAMSAAGGAGLGSWADGLAESSGLVAAVGDGLALTRILAAVQAEALGPARVPMATVAARLAVAVAALPEARAGALASP
jgi:hypothetical protein